MRSAAGPLNAYVLHSYDWSESSLILELLTRERGRIAVAAKGAKRPYSQLRAVLLPFQRLHVALARTADEAADIHTLRSAEWAGGAPMLGGSALFSGFYLNELMLRTLARHDPHPALFDAYAQTIALLHGADDDATAQAALRAFELCVLRECGVLPELDRQTQTQQPLQPHERYALRAEHGLGPAAAAADALPGSAWLALEPALQACPQDGLSALQAAAQAHRAALRPMLRALLLYHAGASSWRTRDVLHGLARVIDTRAGETPAAGRSPVRR